MKSLKGKRFHNSIFLIVCPSCFVANTYINTKMGAHTHTHPQNVIIHKIKRKYVYAATTKELKMYQATSTRSDHTTKYHV